LAISTNSDNDCITPCFPKYAGAETRRGVGGAYTQEKYPTYTR